MREDDFYEVHWIDLHHPTSPVSFVNHLFICCAQDLNFSAGYEVFTEMITRVLILEAVDCPIDVSAAKYTLVHRSSAVPCST